MSRRHFLLCFVSLCVAFVPVYFFVGLMESIQPVSSLIPTFGVGSGLVVILILIHVLIYVGLFMVIGAGFHGLIRTLPSRPVRLTCVSLIFAMPVLCSFVPVITYSSIQGSGGTYTFWGAVYRYFEKYH